MDESATLRGESTVQTEPEQLPGSVEMRKGAVVGRYVVLREVGRGAMGAVYAAYDPRLDRRIALKLLLERSRRADAIARLLREAQSLARLDHPNVVTVHDVGEHEDHVFVAMEFVAGTTLRQWQREQARPWRAIVAVYRQAAAGLAAAHAAGVVHRDFKPENAMVILGRGAEPIVKVMDFGLARSGPRSSDGSGADDGDGDGDEPTVTGAGTLVGTPAYMSPEQFEQREVGPASDQFGFCVALWEALVGERPFAGTTLHELAAAVGAGRMREPSRRGAAPGWLLRIVRKGLARSPDERHASMDALVEAIDRGLSGHRRLLVVAGSVGVVGLAIAGTLHADDDAACRRAAAEMRGIWSPARGAEIEAAFVQTGHASAQDSWQRARSDLDAFVAAWIEQHDNLCGAWRGTVAEDLLALRRECLLEQRSHLEGLLDTFAKPTAETIAFAVAATSGLPGPDECAQIDSLDEAPPADWAEEVAAAQRLAARGRALRFAGDALGAAELYAEALSALGDVPAPRARARILAAQADLLAFQGELAQSELDFAEAHRLAAESGDKKLLAKLWLDRIFQLNMHHPDQLDRQEHLLEAAELAVVQAGRDPVHIARLHIVRGVIALDRGDTAEAQTQLEEGIAAAERSEATPAAVGSYHDLLGHLFLQKGDYARAREEMSRALAIVVDAYGSAYTSVRTFHGNLGGICLMMGDHGCAREHFEAVQSLLDAAGDRASPARGHNLAQLAELEKGEGHIDLARAYAERSVEVWRELGLQESVECATSKAVLLGLAREQGRHEEALTLAREVERIDRERRPAGSPDSVRGLKFVADALADLGRYEEALVAVERVIAVRTAALGPDHESVGIAIGTRAEWLAAMGKNAAALVDARRAHEIFVAFGSRPDLRGASAFMLARLLWETGEHTGALELAREALRDYDRSTADTSERRSEALAWLRERGVDPVAVRD